MNNTSKYRHTQRWQIVAIVVTACFCSCLALVSGFYFGSQVNPVTTGSAQPLWASSAAFSDNMAVATGAISDDAEGVFFLDNLTGDLQCLVYYPRFGGFGARFFTNVLQQLPGGGKNAKYLMVTGQALPRATTGITKPGGSLVYVTDVNSGMFAAYAVPWNNTAEASGRVQAGPLVFVGGGPIRNYQIRDPGKNAGAGIPAVVDPNAVVPK
ncbi:MAG: hypothetical protein KDB03_15150 [Planctomycetales bacterium]|nr:hypothetical protein [Planctomycetales bacterium]